MVQKYCKRGVYSGNTLRAFNSLYRRRYAKQGCVVRKMLGQTDTTSEIYSSMLGVNANDVVFSLNKKRRWSLALCIQQAIASDLSSKLVLFEKHKLKRQANCIAFYSNKGNRKRLVPRPGRYFSEKSVLNCHLRSKRKRRNDRRLRYLEDKEPEVESLQDPVPEIRYEIFYPCSIKSSIAHNPKYITSAVKDGNNHPEVGQSRKKRGKKRRLSWNNVRDLVDYYETEIGQEGDVSENEENEDEYSRTSYKANMSSSLVSEPLRLSEFVIDSASKENRTSQKYPKLRNKFSVHTVPDSKSRRIVYTNDNGGFEYRPNVTDVNNVNSKMPDTIQSLFSVPVTANLRIMDTEPQVLRRNYGDTYYEANTIPRKFIIDISEKVKEFVAKSRFFKHIIISNFDFSSYLVFTHTGSQHDEELITVTLNTNLNVNTIGINTLYDGSTSSVNDAIERTLAFYCTITEDMLVPRPSSCCRYASPLLNFELVKSVNKWYVQGDFLAWDTMPSQSNENLSEEIIHRIGQSIFCEICFEQTNVDICDGKPFTALRPCKHWFCDDCWRTYILNSITSGLLNIKCPEHECDTVVDITTMLCFVNIRDINHLRQRNLNTNVQASQNKKWCPYPGCGRVLVTSAADNDTTAPSSLVCGCGTHLCFICMQPAHWPATCNQSKVYRDEIIKRGDYIHLLYHDEPFITEIVSFVNVEGKSCPRCCYFIEKNGGCPSIICPCGASFCWTCLQEWNTHNPAKCAKASKVSNFKQILLDATVRDENNTILSPVLYCQALDRRLARHPDAVIRLRAGSRALAKRLNHLGGKDFTTRILIEQQSASMTVTTNLLNQLHYVLRRFLGIKLELDHVIEFTAIRLLNETNKHKKQVLSSMISRLEDISFGFKTVFEYGGNQNMTEVLPHLSELEKRASKEIATLSKHVHT